IRRQIALVDHEQIGPCDPRPTLSRDVGVDPDAMVADARAARGSRPVVSATIKSDDGVDAIVAFLVEQGGLAVGPAELTGGRHTHAPALSAQRA
ncbi:MAG: hypothetical protein AAFR55_09005, partial [Pseudomonadota bacterium]